MDISEIRKISFDGDREIRPWIDPATVTGIDREASKKLYKNLWYARYSGDVPFDQTDPENDTKKLFDYIYECSSWWNSLSDGNEPLPEELCEITTVKLIKAGIFFIHYLGYQTAGALLMWIAKLRSNNTINKKIFDLYKTAFEEEDEPHLKWCLQDNFLDFFGYLPAFTDVHNKTNWDGLPEEDLAYLSHLHTHRMREPTTLLAP